MDVVQKRRELRQPGVLVATPLHGPQAFSGASWIASTVPLQEPAIEETKDFLIHPNS